MSLTALAAPLAFAFQRLPLAFQGHPSHWFRTARLSVLSPAPHFWHWCASCEPHLTFLFTRIASCSWGHQTLPLARCTFSSSVRPLSLRRVSRNRTDTFLTAKPRIPPHAFAGRPDHRHHADSSTHWPRAARSSCRAFLSPAPILCRKCALHLPDMTLFDA